MCYQGWLEALRSVEGGGDMPIEETSKSYYIACSTKNVYREYSIITYTEL